MRSLYLPLIRAGGWPRMALIASCTAATSGLLLVVVALLRLPPRPDEFLSALVADPGTRGGTALATALLALPALFLLNQAVRVGTPARDRRLATLRLAGATPAEVRRLGALEVGLPAGLGSAFGIAVFLALRALIGGSQFAEPFTGAPRLRLQLVPTTVGPSWWEAALVVLAVTASGLAVGLLASRRVIVSPLGVTRRQSSAPPRPWGLLLLGMSGLVATAAFMSATGSEIGSLAAVVMSVLGVLSLGPWVAYRVGRFVATRATSAAMLLASRHLVTEPRPAGRAAAAVGAIALVAGGAGSAAADIIAMGSTDPFYVQSLALVAIVLLVALVVATGTIAVHSVESLLDRKRSIAALRALGVGGEVLERARRLESSLVAMPMAAAGVFLGSLTLVFTTRSVVGLLISVATMLVTLALVWLAIAFTIRSTRSFARHAGLPNNLRTE